MKKTLTKILAVIGAIAAAAALIYLFRDRIAQLLEDCKCCKKDFDLDNLEGSVEEAIEKAEDKAEDFVEQVEDKAEAVVEEFKDYADVATEE